MTDTFSTTRNRAGLVIILLPASAQTLKVSAGIHRIVYQDYHRLLSRVFPFGIFYTLDQDVAVVWAVIDLRKDPAWIRERLL